MFSKNKPQNNKHTELNTKAVFTKPKLFKMQMQNACLSFINSFKPVALCSSKKADDTRHETCHVIAPIFLH